MSYLKSMATSFVYIAFFLAVITFSPGLPPVAQFSEYSIKPSMELQGVLAPNERLNDPEILFDGEIKGPESFDSYNGELYTGLHGGNVGKIVGNKIIPVVKFGEKCGGIWEEEKCGRPLGLKFDKQGRLYVADTYYGLFKVDVKTGKYEKLFDASQPIDGKIPKLINSLDVASNGDVYWTESSTDFKIYDGAFAMLANPSGRLIRYNAATRKNEVLLNDLAFANGLKLSDDESYVIVAETMSSTLIKYNLKGVKSGKREIFAEGLPGAPDNVHSDGEGNFLVSLVLPTDPDHPLLTQTLIPHPYIRKMLARLLALAEVPFKLLDDFYPSDFAKKVTHAIGSFETTKFMYQQKVTVLRIDGNGKIIDALHNSDEKIAGISSAFVHDDYLWLGSPFNEFLARVSLKKAFPKSDFTRKAKEASRAKRDAPNLEKTTAAPPKVEKTTAAPPKVEKTTAAQPRVEKTTAAQPRVEKTTAAPPRVEKTTAAPPKVEKTTAAPPKVEKTTAAPPKVEKTTAAPPRVEKVEKVRGKEAEKAPEKKQEAPKKVETPKAKSEIPVRENEAPKPTKQAEKPAKKAETKEEELPRPIKQAEKPKTQKKSEPTKRSAKIADEI